MDTRKLIKTLKYSLADKEEALKVFSAAIDVDLDCTIEYNGELCELIVRVYAVYTE